MLFFLLVGIGVLVEMNKIVRSEFPSFLTLLARDEAAEQPRKDYHCAGQEYQTDEEHPVDEDLALLLFLFELITLQFKKLFHILGRESLVDCLNKTN